MRFSSVALRILLASWLVCDVHQAFSPIVQQPRSQAKSNNLHLRHGRGWALYANNNDDDGERKKSGFFFSDTFKYESTAESRAALGVTEEEGSTVLRKNGKGEDEAAMTVEQATLTPHPPEEPPSLEMVAEQQQNPLPEAVETEPVKTATIMTEKTKQEVGNAAKVVKEKVVDPMFTGEFEKGVPQSTILAASLFCAIIAFTTTQRASCAVATLFTVGFLAITSGPLGEFARTIGDITVDTSERILIFLQEVGVADTSNMLAGPAPRIARTLSNTKKGRLEQIRKVEAEVKQILKEADNAVAGADGQMEEIQRLQAEVRTVLREADDVISNAVRLQEDSAQYLDDVLAQEEYLEEKASVADEEIARIAEEAYRIAEEATKIADEAQLKKRAVEQAAALAAEERARAKAEAIAKEAEKLAIEARRVAEKEAQLVEEAKLAKEKATADNLAEVSRRLAEEARLAEESSQQAKDEKGGFTDDDWETSIELAQEQLGRKIVGIDVGETDEATKVNWDKAERLAQSLGGSGGSEPSMFDDDDDDDDETPADMEAIAKAARAAVEKFEQGKVGSSVPSSSNTRSTEFQTGRSDQSFAAAWEMTMGIGRKVESRQDVDEYVDDESIFDDEITEDDDWEPTIDDEILPFDDGEELGMKEIAAAARAAVEMSQQVAPEDDIAARARAAVEMAKQLDGFMDTEDIDVFIDEEDDVFFDDNFGNDEGIPEVLASPPPSTSTSKDWSKLTVAQLKEELTSRGLPTAGKKKDLVAALEEDDKQQLLGTDGVTDDFLAFGSAVVDDDDDMIDFGSAMVDDTTSSSSAVVDEIDLSTMDSADLGRAAREAAAMFDSEEPSDEVLMQLENDAFNFDIDDDDDDDNEDGNDNAMMESNKYLSMTVAELKAELKRRGLKVSGKKTELIARLESSE